MPRVAAAEASSALNGRPGPAASLPVAALTAAVAVAATLPLAAVELRRLLDVEHYGFWPLAFGAFFVVLWCDRPTEAVPHAAVTGTASAVLFVSGLGCLGLALWLDPPSPWLGYVAFVLTSAGAFWRFFGPAAHAALPAWAILLVLVRPPLNYDAAMVRSLQGVAASLASWFLDQLGVMHIRHGVALELPSQVLFVEEACSGAQSLFSSLFVAVLLAVWGGRGLVWSALLVAAAVGAAVLANAFRIVVTAFVLARYDVSLLEAPWHTLLGYATFALAVAAVLAFNRPLMFLLGPIRSDVSPEPNMWVRLWNGDADEAAVPVDPPAKAGPRFGVVLSAATLLAAVGAGYWLASGRLSFTRFAGSRTEGAEEVIDSLDRFGKGTFGADLRDWPVGAFEIVRRPEMHLFGAYTRQWDVASPAGTGVLTLDYPFPGWHDLRDCYANIGWFVAENWIAPTDDGPACVVQSLLTKADGTQALLTFGLFRQDLSLAALGQADLPTGRLTRRLAGGDQAAEAQVADRQQMVQVQLLLQLHVPLEPEIRRAAMTRFLDARDRVRRRLKREAES